MRLISSLWMVLGIAMCASAMADEQASCREDDLRISAIPLKDMQQLIEEYRPLANMLSAGLGMPVRILHASSYESVIDAVVSGGTDIAAMGPVSYLIARQLNPDIEPFASLVPAPGHFSPSGNYYSSLLLVRSDSKLNRVRQLRGRRVALSDPASTSGGLIPKHEFAAMIGEPLGDYFSRQVYAGSHDRALDALLAGRVDAAFVSSERADDYLQRGLIDKGSLQILWRSDPIYYDPLVFSAAVCESLRQRIRQLISTPSPELETFIRSQRAVNIAPVGHEAYQALEPLLQEKAAAAGP